MRECVDSILRQTYSHLDVILVDDGSPDLCGQIAEDYAKGDSRVRVIHQSNAGLSAARNAGTQCALGNWITFVDGDDSLKPGCIEYLYTLASRGKAQLAICPMRGFKKRERRTKEIIRMYDRKQALEEMLYQRAFDTSACAKLFRTTDALQVPFPAGRLFEDLFTVYQLIWRAERIAYGSQVQYIYRMRQDSIMHTAFVPGRFDEIEAVDQLVSFAERECPDLLRAANSRRFSAYCQTYLAIPRTKKAYEQERGKIWRTIRRSSPDVFANPKARIKNRAAALLALFGEPVFRWAWQLVM